MVNSKVSKLLHEKRKLDEIKQKKILFNSEYKSYITNPWYILSLLVGYILATSADFSITNPLRIIYYGFITICEIVFISYIGLSIGFLINKFVILKLRSWFLNE